MNGLIAEYAPGRQGDRTLGFVAVTLARLLETFRSLPVGLVLRLLLLNLLPGFPDAVVYHLRVEGALGALEVVPGFLILELGFR